jgi:hypothetical protein
LPISFLTKTRVLARFSYKLRIPYLKCFRFCIFQILEDLHVHNEISWSEGPKSKYEINLYFIYVLYIDRYDLKVILCNMLNSFMHQTELHGIEFSTCGTMSTLKDLKL